MAVQEYGGSDSEGVEALASTITPSRSPYSNFRMLLRRRRKEEIYAES